LLKRPLGKGVGTCRRTPSRNSRTCRRRKWPRQLSKSAGPQASVPEKTAEAVGERAGDAYADPGSAAARNLAGNIARLALPDERSGAVRQVLDEQPFQMVAAGFALGYMTALLLHRRR